MLTNDGVFKELTALGLARAFLRIGVTLVLPAKLGEFRSKKTVGGAGRIDTFLGEAKTGFG